MKILYGLAVILSLLIITTAQAAPAGRSMAFWTSLPFEEQQAFLVGAMEILGGLSLQCPGTGKVALKDVRDGLTKRLQTGQSRPEDRFGWEVITVHYSLGCALDKRMLDALDPALRKKLPQ